MNYGQLQIALFVDLENLISTIKHQSQKGIGDFGTQASIDFEALIQYIENQFGSINQENFFVIANFAHYNQQLGGLNRMATLINMDSFEAREVRSKQQHSPGKRHVIQNYSDMAIAFQAGIHLANTPADIYIFVTGDAAFASVASLIQERYKRQVHFILPDEDKAAAILKERFLCFPFSETQPERVFVKDISAKNGYPSIEPVETKSNQNTRAIQKAVAQLRGEFHTAIPTELIRSLIGPKTAQQQLGRARTEEVIDLWTNEGENVEKNKFISLQKERLYGKIIKMETRPSLLQASRVLLSVAQTAEQTEKPASRADWRKQLKKQLNISNAESKKWLDLLLKTEILRDERIQNPVITLDSVIPFIHQAETNDMPPRNE